MRLPRRIQRMLLVMTIPALAFIFTLFATAESRATDKISTSGTCNSAGTCLWSLGSDGTLTISAKNGAEDVKMANYYCMHNPCDQSTLISRPWEASLQQIKSVVIGDNITRIGDDAFQAANNLTSVTGMKDVKTIGSNGVFASTGLTSITIPEGVTSIGSEAFSYNGSLTSITIPEGVTYIGAHAFQYATSLTSITIPEGVTYIGWNAFWGAKSLTSITIPDNIDTENWRADVFYGLPAGTNIICQGDLDTCYEKLAKYIPTDKGGTCTNSDLCIYNEILPAQSSEQCSGSYIYENGNCHKRNEEQCNATGKYYYNGATCLYRPLNRQVVCVNPNYKANDGYCDRLRYTPAEAAKVLKDDNNNSVTITFKM